MSQTVAADPDDRSTEQLREHYEVERRLASQLKSAPKKERAHLYSSLYDELFRSVPHHPQITRKTTTEFRAREIDYQLSFLRKFLLPTHTFAEIGPGDCLLSVQLCSEVEQVIAIDVSAEITSSTQKPSNFKLVISDGVSIPVPASSLSVVYSNQLMEHLHPDDALEQLGNILTSLRSDGAYVCITPNRVTGPHDVSAHFSSVAEGFHLKEYTIGELARIFRKVGFPKVEVFVGGKGKFRAMPAGLLSAFESVFALFPHALRMRLKRKLPFRLISTIRIVGYR